MCVPWAHHSIDVQLHIVKGFWQSLLFADLFKLGDCTSVLSSRRVQQKEEDDLWFLSWILSCRCEGFETD